MVSVTAYWADTQGALVFRPAQFSRMCTTSTREYDFPDSKVHGANMGPIWGRQDSGGIKFGSMNRAIWVGRRVMTPGAVKYKPGESW